MQIIQARLPPLPDLEAGVVLADTETSEALTLTNRDTDGPGAYAVSFSPDYLDAFETGDLDTEVSLFACTAGATVDVALKRNANMPASGAAQTVTMTVTCPGGRTKTVTISVEPAALLASAVADLATPTLEYRMDGTGTTLVNSGSLGTSYNATIAGTHTRGSSTQQGAENYVELTTTTSQASVTAPQASTYTTAGQDRSLVVLFKVVGTPAGTGLLGVFDSNHIDGYLQNSSGVLWHRTGAGLLESASHTDGGASDDCDLLDGNIYLVASIFDSTANTITARWKKTGDRAGHSFRSAARANASPSGSSTWYPIGVSSTSCNDIRFFYVAIIDHKITEAEFADLLVPVGLA